MYIACKEGKTDILRYFLDYNLNPTIESIINTNEKESCLEVASRWGYLKIIELLVGKVSYSKDDINKAIKSANSGKIIYALKKQMKRKSFRCCF